MENGRHYEFTNGNPIEISNGNHLQNGYISVADPSDDEYIDTVEVYISYNINNFMWD